MRSLAQRNYYAVARIILLIQFPSQSLQLKHLRFSLRYKHLHMAFRPFPVWPELRPHQTPRGVQSINLATDATWSSRSFPPQSLILQQVTSGEVAEKSVGMWHGTTTMENGVAVPPKIKNRAAI